MSLSIRQIVFSDLDNAHANGAFCADDGSLYGATPEEIALDMIALAADCEDLSVEEIQPHIEEWLQQQEGGAP